MEIVKSLLKIQPKKATNIRSNFNFVIVVDGQSEVTFSLNMHAPYLNVSAKVASGGDDEDNSVGGVLWKESLQFRST